jgi:hypothetical protein
MRVNSILNADYLTQALPARGDVTMRLTRDQGRRGRILGLTGVNQIFYPFVKILMRRYQEYVDAVYLLGVLVGNTKLLALVLEMVGIHHAQWLREFLSLLLRIRLDLHQRLLDAFA